MSTMCENCKDPYKYKGNYCYFVCGYADNDTDNEENEEELEEDEEYD